MRSAAHAEVHRKIALALTRRGLVVVACNFTGDREPLYSGWTELKPTVKQVEQWFDLTPNPYEPGKVAGPYAGAAIGIVAGLSGLLVIDDDLYKKVPGGKFAGEPALADLGDLAGVPTVTTPKGGRHYYFRQRPDARIGCSRGDLPLGIDVKGDGGFVFAPATSTFYGTYSDLHPDEIVSAPFAPDWLMTRLQATPAYSAVGSCSLPSGALSELREPLRFIDPDCDHERWFSVLATIFEYSGGSEDGRALAHEWSAGGKKYHDTVRHKRDGKELIDFYWAGGGGKIRGFRIRNAPKPEIFIRNLAFEAGWVPERPTFAPAPPMTPSEAYAEQKRALAEAMERLRTPD
jgi:hypothetical protein